MTGESLAGLPGNSEAGSRRWLFAGAVLDERSLTLTVDGQPQALDPKPLEVLLHLLSHAGEVVTKDELLAAVWPGRILSDSGLTSCIARLREALRDQDQGIVRTVHGYGYRLIAPVSVEASVAPTPPRFAFGAGDPLHGRPHWKLERRLGAGGHGEAWLALHEKTRAARVFKFALEPRHLTSLKREITLNRLLCTALGDAAPVIKVLDWNLEAAPYFLELEHVAGGSLVEWVEAQGGFAAVTLADRLEIAAQIAEALAAAHALGVLHKDLKPSNVLIERDGAGALRVKLGDFGSGGVIDPARLEALGITRLGFTGTAGEPSSTSGTPIYFAPEVVAGQPSTVKADLYALGIVLYQLVCGDLRKTLAPGWERDIADELLREDIAAAADGDASKRLGDAAELAQRLRSLGARRDARAVERQRGAEAQRLAAQLQRAQARRPWAYAAGVLLVVGLLVNSFLYYLALEQKARAENAVHLEHEINRFLDDDVLGFADPASAGRNDLTVRALLESAEGKLDRAFVGQEATRAKLSLTLGRSYFGLGLWPRAGARLARALEDARKALREDDPLVLDIEAQLAQNRVYEARYEEAQRLYEHALGAAVKHHGPLDARSLKLRIGLARLWWESDQFERAVREFESLRELVRGNAPALLDEVEWALADLYPEMNRLRDGEALARSTLERTRIRYGASSTEALWESVTLGDTLVIEGRWPEAEQLFRDARQGFEARFGADHPRTLTAAHYLGLIRLQQGRAAEALPLLKAAMDGRLRVHGELHTWAHYSMNRVGEALLALHRPVEARTLLERALQAVDRAGHRRQAYALLIIDNLARAEIALGNTGRAEQLVDEGLQTAATIVPPRNLRVGLLLRTQGTLRARQGRCADAHQSYARAVEVLSAALGEGQVDLREARELAAARGCRA